MHLIAKFDRSDCLQVRVVREDGSTSSVFRLPSVDAVAAFAKAWYPGMPDEEERMLIIRHQRGERRSDGLDPRLEEIKRLSTDPKVSRAMYRRLWGLDGDPAMPETIDAKLK